MAKTGIFWIYQGNVIAKTRTAQESDHSVNGLLDSPDNHVDYWEEVIVKNPAYSALWEMEYFHIPRGRVLLMTTGAAARVYLDKVLLNEANKTLISDAFQLEGLKIQWRIDEHYTTDVDGLNAFFD